MTNKKLADKVRGSKSELFSDRPTAIDALDYGQELLAAYGVPAAVSTTALMVMYNSTLNGVAHAIETGDN